MDDLPKSLRDELAHFESSSIAEIAARNPSVMEYMKHWEARAEAAEAKLAEVLGGQPYTYYGKDGKPVLARDLEDRAEAAEAKLAVAVEALEDALNRMEEDRASGDCGNWDWVDGDVYSRGRATLAEIKA